MNVNGTLLINYGGPLVNYQMSAGEIITGIAIILLGFVVFMFLCCIYISKCGTKGCGVTCCGNVEESSEERRTRHEQEQATASTHNNQSSYIPELRGLEDLEQYLEDRCLADLPAYIRETIEGPPSLTGTGRLPGKPVHAQEDDPPPTYEEAVKVIEEEKKKVDDGGHQQSTSRE